MHLVPRPASPEMPVKTPNKRPEDDKQGGKSPRRKGTASGKPWTPHPSNSAVLVPSARLDMYPQNVCELVNGPPCSIPGGYIMEGVLFGQVVASETLELGEVLLHMGFNPFNVITENHIPSRYDSVYLHPETMKYSGLTIAQLVLVKNTSNKKV